MKWIGQHIWDFVSRFRNDIYLEDISSDTIVSGGNLGLDENNKVVKATVASGGVTSVNSVTGAVTAAHIATAVEAASDSNTFTDADHTKLNAAVINTGNETIAGTKTFSSAITGDISGNAGTVTNGVYTTSSVNVLADVDTSSVAANDILVWNGSSFVVESMNALVTNNYLFTFSVTSFSDGISATQLIGTGDWKAADALTYTAVYVAGPPSTSATIQKAINSTSVYSDVNSMDSSAFTTGNNDAAVTYPSARDQYLRFRLKVVDGGATTYTEDAAKIYFKNYIYYGASSSTSLDEAGIEGLSGSTISSSFTSSRSVNSSAGTYVYLAYPSGYTDIHADGFKFNSITCPFESKAIVEVTNSAGYTEDYDVYRSTNSNLGNHTLNLSTSSSLTNTIFWGVTTATSSIDVSSFVGGIGSSDASNDNTRVWDSITAGSGQYLLFAWPARLSDPTFYIGGFAGGFAPTTTANYTNANGYIESYKFFRSTNPNLGAVVVTTS